MVTQLWLGPLRVNRRVALLSLDLTLRTPGVSWLQMMLRLSGLGNSVRLYRGVSAPSV